MNRDVFAGIWAAQSGVAVKNIRYLCISKLSHIYSVGVNTLCHCDGLAGVLAL